jgi:Ni/Co efflux regulator RcnB
MRKLLLAALAVTTLVPVAAQAQSAGEVRRDLREMRQDRHEVRRDVRRGDYREAREDQRDVRRDRREIREDWRDYRQTHRDVYRRPAYVGPRGYAYRPVAVGYRFQPQYYRNQYWVNNYSNYRLRAPGRGARWVRYGNDVVLVNVRTGRVIEVYNRFFW